MSNRLLIALAAGCFLVVSASNCSAFQIGDAMVKYLDARVGVTLGGGECAHMATEALRVNGGEFFPADLGADFPSKGDYVWGDLVTQISIVNKVWKDSNPTVNVKAGDIIQFGAAKIGTITFPTKHTAVVRTLNSSTVPRPATILQQNFGGKRTVQQTTINLSQLTAGWVRIYRPRPRIDVANVYKFTVTNTTSVTNSYEIWIGTTKAAALSLSAANSAGAFRIHKISTGGTVPTIVAPLTKSNVYLQTSKSNRLVGSPTVVEQVVD